MNHNLFTVANDLVQSLKLTLDNNHSKNKKSTRDFITSVYIIYLIAWFFIKFW